MDKDNKDQNTNMDDDNMNPVHIQAKQEGENADRHKSDPPTARDATSINPEAEESITPGSNTIHPA